MIGQLIFPSLKNFPNLKMPFFPGMIIPILVLLLHLLSLASAKEKPTMALTSARNDVNDTEAIRKALDDFTTCVIQKSGINSMLPAFLTESITKIFGDQCGVDQPNAARVKRQAGEIRGSPGGLQGGKGPIPAIQFPICDNITAYWPMVPYFCNESNACIHQFGYGCRNSKGDLEYRYQQNVEGETDYVSRCVLSEKKAISTCSKEKNLAPSENCFCNELALPVGSASAHGTGQDQALDVWKCAQKCGSCQITAETVNTRADGTIDSSEMSVTINCSHMIPYERGLERQCWQSVAWTISSGNEDTETHQDCGPPTRATPFSEKMLNASLECMSQVDSVECCTHEGVARECLPLCGQGDLKDLSLKELSVCQLHFGTIMKCYVQKVTGKAYDKNQEQCAEACAICDSVKACSLTQFLPGSLGDFALSLCLAEGNMQCKLAKLRGGCL